MTLVQMLSYRIQDRFLFFHCRLYGQLDLLLIKCSLYISHRKHLFDFMSFNHNLPHDIISYPMFVHVIRKDIYGGVPYHMRPEAECDTAPHHRYLPYCVEQTGDNKFII